jgi:hypothetical protein
MMKTYDELLEENNKLKEVLRRYKGIEQPFICGGSAEKGKDGLPDMIFVCPMMGADGMAVYVKHKDYSAPSY